MSERTPPSTTRTASPVIVLCRIWILLTWSTSACATNCPLGGASGCWVAASARWFSVTGRLRDCTHTRVASLSRYHLPTTRTPLTSVPSVPRRPAFQPLCPVVLRYETTV